MLAVEGDLSGRGNPLPQPSDAGTDSVIIGGTQGFRQLRPLTQQRTPVHHTLLRDRLSQAGGRLGAQQGHASESAEVATPRFAAAKHIDREPRCGLKSLSAPAE